MRPPPYTYSLHRKPPPPVLEMRRYKLPLRIRVAEGNMDEVPAKWSTLVLKGLETQENVFAANTNMTNVICIPMALPEVWADCYGLGCW